MYEANEYRYEKMQYKRCGKSGLMLPRISLGLWHNFGEVDRYDTSKAMIRRAFDLGITHFDLANNYGPPAGSAETNFGRILKEDFKPYRNEMVISTKAGYKMWEGPYGDWGSKKYLVSSLDDSLKRMGLDYVDIFYHHRPDVNTPLEETMGALHHIVQQGKALYVGLSNYQPEEAKEAIRLLKAMGTPCLIHQPNYSMLNRWVEDGLLDLLEEEQVGAIPFSPLAGGRLTDRYLNGIPKDSRAAKQESPFLKEADITPELLEKLHALDEVAKARGQKLAQMALAWVLRQEAVTSVLIGASRVSQIDDCVGTLENLAFTDEECKKIDSILAR